MTRTTGRPAWRQCLCGAAVGSCCGLWLLGAPEGFALLVVATYLSACVGVADAR